MISEGLGYSLDDVYQVAMKRGEGLILLSPSVLA